MILLANAMCVYVFGIPACHGRYRHGLIHPIWQTSELNYDTV